MLLHVVIVTLACGVGMDELVRPELAEVVGVALGFALELAFTKTVTIRGKQRKTWSQADCKAERARECTHIDTSILQPRLSHNKWMTTPHGPPASF